MVHVVNVVAGGDLDREIDLYELACEIGETVHSVKGNESSLYLKLNESGPLIMLYRTGKYVITGIENLSSVNPAKQAMASLLSDLGVIQKEPSIEIYNIVCKASLNSEYDLSNIALILGLDRTEYEPEQSPFLIYRPIEYDCVITISSSGESVINGVKDRRIAEDAFQHLNEYLEEKLSKS